jgi:hypothetical protein
MAQPLREAADLLACSQKGVLVLVTDGQITGEDDLLRSLEPRLGATTIHCVGVDRAVNAGFLDRLARQGRGRFELVESEYRLDEVMAALARTIERPALSGIKISGRGIEIIETSITPAPAPDAFAGVPCVISGRYRGPLDSGATISAAAAGAKEPFGVTLIPLRSDAAAVRTIWARAALRDLEDAYASGRGSDRRLNHRIVEHSIRFGVLSRFTAFVAVDPERTDAGVLDEVVQPVELPSGWTMPAMSRPVAVMARAAMAPPPSGTDAIRASGGTATTRSLEEILRALERLLAGPHMAVDRLGAVRNELVAYREQYLQFRTPLARLCEAIDVYMALSTAPTDSDRQRIATAVEAVRAAMLAQTRPARRSNKRFWE